MTMQPPALVSAFPNPPVFYKKYAPLDEKEPTKWDPR
jgi:hypothetical protein